MKCVKKKHLEDNFSTACTSINNNFTIMFINEIAKALNVSTYKQIQTYNSPCARDKAGN